MLVGVRGSGVLLMNVSRCSARVRINFSVHSLCMSFVKVSCISLDNLLTCVLLEKGGAMQCCGNRSAEPDTRYPVVSGT